MLRKSLLASTVCLMLAIASGADAGDVVPFSANWSYLNPSTDPAATDASFNSTWYKPSYDDNGWGGPAPEPFARVENGNNRIQAFTESDVVDFIRPIGTALTLPLAGNRLTSFYRADFTTTEATTDLALQYLVDDGARFYLDGEEIYSIKCCETGSRDPIPPGTTIDFFSEATSQPTANEKTYTLIPLTGFTLDPGDHTLAVSVHQTSPTQNDMAMSARLIDDYQLNPVIQPREEWQYFEGRAEPEGDALAWTQVGYDDGDWESGKGGFGYDADNGTLDAFEENLGTDIDMRDTFSTVYFRKSFTVADIQLYDGAELVADYDDGFVAYLNGVEVVRSFVNDATYPIGQAVPYNGLADSHESTNGDGDPGDSFAIDLQAFPGILSTGDNVLAIHGMNTTIGSSDFFLGQLELTLTGGGALPDFTAGSDGDVNGDGTLDAFDIDLISKAVRDGDGASQFDVNGDGAVNGSDRIFWIEDLANTYVGDSTLDGRFDDGDIVATFIVGKYASGDDAGWAAGDWDGDGVYDNNDIVAAFIKGGYQKPPRAAVAAVPEPASLSLLLAGLILAQATFRRRKP